MLIPPKSPMRSQSDNSIASLPRHGFATARRSDCPPSQSVRSSESSHLPLVPGRARVAGGPGRRMTDSRDSRGLFPAVSLRRPEMHFRRSDRPATISSPLTSTAPKSRSGLRPPRNGSRRVPPEARGSVVGRRWGTFSSVAVDSAFSEPAMSRLERLSQAYGPHIRVGIDRGRSMAASPVVPGFAPASVGSAVTGGPSQSGLPAGPCDAEPHRSETESDRFHASVRPSALAALPRCTVLKPDAPI
jgi:hypothetical protein